MSFQGWRQREQDGRNRIAEREEREADPEYQAKLAGLREHYFAEEEKNRLAAEAERERVLLERYGPVRAVAALFRERFPDELPEVYTVLTKREGLARLLPLLKAMVGEDLTARREAADAARREAERAQMVEEGERRLAEQAKAEARRKAKAGTKVAA